MAKFYHVRPLHATGIKKIIDEINADISPYQTRYENVIFAIYDLGFIRDQAEFKGSIERNLNVHVVIIKK